MRRCSVSQRRQNGSGGATGAREIVALDCESGRLLVRLPLPIYPSRFCFNADGEHVRNGIGRRCVAIVSPFQNEVDQTILAGRTPYAMAVLERQNLLFVTNPESGDLTILDIETRHVSASVHVGENPGEVLITPDGEYALVLDQVRAMSQSCGLQRSSIVKCTRSRCLPCSRRRRTRALPSSFRSRR